MDSDNTSKEHQNLRWHDNSQELSEAIGALQFIPEEVRGLISAGFISRADANHNAAEIVKTLKSMGSDKVLAIYNSKNKRREYDTDPNLHKISNYFLVLPEASQNELAVELIEFTTAIVDYLAVCDTLDLPREETMLDNMNQIFVKKGGKSVQEYVDKLHEEFKDELEGPSSQVLDEKASTTFVEKDSDVKIKKDNA